MKSPHYGRNVEMGSQLIPNEASSFKKGLHQIKLLAKVAPWEPPNHSAKGIDCSP